MIIVTLAEYNKRPSFNNEVSNLCRLSLAQSIDQCAEKRINTKDSKRMLQETGHSNKYDIQSDVYTDMRGRRGLPKI